MIKIKGISKNINYKTLNERIKAQNCSLIKNDKSNENISNNSRNIIIKNIYFNKSNNISFMYKNNRNKYSISQKNNLMQ